MVKTFATAIAQVLAHEGGYSSHPKDPGGCTNRGITLATYRRYVDPLATCAEVRDMPRDEAVWIYRRGFWDAVEGDHLPAGVDLAVFDWAVNSGPKRAITGLQRCVDVTADGRLGPITLSAAHAYRPQSDLVRSLCAERLAFLSTLKHWRTFKRGWQSRVRNVEVGALALVADEAR